MGKKKQLSSKVSNKVIDAIYNKGISAGAYGGKLSGAGAGGFMSFIVPSDKKRSVREALGHLEELPFEIENVGSSIIYYQS